MRKLSLILIIVGVLVIAAPIAGQLYTRYNENKMIDEWLNSDNAQTIENEGTSTAAAGTENAEDSYNQLQNIFSTEGSGTTDAQQASAQTIGSDTTNSPSSTKKPVKTTPHNVIGVIKIDKIKVKAPIVEGVSVDDLKVGVGHIPGTANLGDAGNCALAGHRSYTFGKFFNRLDEVKAGDYITLITKKGEYKYKVFEKLVVKPEDVSVLKGSKKDNVISLITCTPIYVASHRLIVKARLESKSEAQP